MSRRAVITTVHPYDRGVVVGSHHIARVLARRGWKVLLMTDPASLAHVSAMPFNRRAARRVREACQGKVEVEPNLTTLTPFTLLPLSGKIGAGSPTVLRSWPKATVPPLYASLAASGFENPDLMIFDGAICYPLRDMLKPAKTVLRLFDFPDGTNVLPSALSQQERQLAAECDIVAISARKLEAIAKGWNARDIVLVQNGVDPTHFSPPTPLPEEYKAIKPPRVVYMGAIATWIDQAMMAEVAARLPHVSFVWIGPGKLTVGGQLPNVHVLGPRIYADLPSYLQHARVGVIPFNMAEHADLVNAVNPLKLYEYAASGLSIVSSPTQEIRRIGGPVRLAEGTDDFVSAISDALAKPESKAVLAAFADRATWDRRVEALLERLGLGH